MTSRKLNLDQIFRLLTTGTTAGMDGPCYTALRRAEFKRATEEGFLVAKRPPRGFGVLWFEWCRYHRHPSVTVQLKRRHATVGLDMFSTEALRLSKSAFRQVSEKMDALDLEWTGSASFIKIKAPFDLAEELAKWLLDLALADKPSWGERIRENVAAD